MKDKKQHSLSSYFQNILVVEYGTQMTARVLLEAHAHALQKNFTHILLIDSKQSYTEDDISKVASAAVANPAAICIGVRPKFHLTKMNVKDPHCTLKCYPVSKLNNLKFIFLQEGSEIETLIRLILAKNQITNVLVQGKSDNAEFLNLKSFASIKKYFRDQLLTISVAVASLLAGETSPSKTAFEVSLGVFIGTTPLFGLHTAIVAGLALLFRLNFIHLFLGSQISFPPLFPFLLLGAQQLGKLLELILQKELTTPVSILAGSLVLALLLSIFTFIGIYFLKVYLNQRKRR